MGERFKVAVGAYQCNPRRGSEYGVGWGWVEAISRHHDLWVLTSASNQKDIEEELSRRPELRKALHFTYISRLRLRWLERIWPPAYLMTYRRQWQKAAFAEAKRLHEEVGFDLTHQITYVGFRVPGNLWKLGIPFVWGPIGGLEQTTWQLVPHLGVRGALHFTGRNVINEIDRRYRGAPKEAMRAAKGGVIAATKGIAELIQRFYGVESEIMSEVGLPKESGAAIEGRSPGERMRLVWCGTLTPGKALPFALRALKRLEPGYEWELCVMGEGPQKRAWRKLAEDLGINERIEWMGRVDRSEVLRRMAKAHGVVISSVYDLTSTVVVEALANGLPVVCPDHCGFQDAVTEECGIRVSAGSAEQLIEGIRGGVHALFDEEKRLKMAQAAKKRSEAYGWQAKGELVDRIYRRKMSERGELKRGGRSGRQ